MKKLIIILISMVPILLLADQNDPVFDDIELDEHIPRKGADQKPAKLGLDGMPTPPLDTNLRNLNINKSTSVFYVDISSISSSKKDNIVRLVTVAISPQGARTVNYEGFDCGYRRYKAYGYGSSDGTIKPYKDQIWRAIVDKGNDRYRATLLDNYFCGGFSYAASRKKILYRMNSLKPYKQE